jgi:hypothetical protein
MKRFAKLLLLVSPVLLCAGVFLVVDNMESSVITVENVGQEEVCDVALHLEQGRVYTIGNVSPGKRVTTSVRADRACHVEVEFSNNCGIRKKVVGGGYFAPGIYTNMEIKLDSADVRSATVIDNRTSWRFW